MSKMATNNSGEALKPIAPLSTYDAGILGNGGGGDIDWWQTYMRMELASAHDFYDSQYDIAVDLLTSRDATLAEVQAERDSARLDAAGWEESCVGARAQLTDLAFQHNNLLKLLSERTKERDAAMAVVEAAKEFKQRSEAVDDHIRDHGYAGVSELEHHAYMAKKKLFAALPQGEATAERQAPPSPGGEQATPIESMVNAAADVQAKHIEMFAAAYIKATNIDPQRAELVQQCTADGFKWWFRERAPASTQPATAEPNDLVQQLLGRAAFCDSRGEVKTPKLLREAAAALASESPRERQSFECYATFRKREDENDGREFFYHALWHNETSVSAGERVVKGRFVPDDEQPANVSSKSELEDRALALELRERQYREALEFYADVDNYFQRPIEARKWSITVNNDQGEIARSALSPTSTAKQTGGGE